MKPSDPTLLILISLADGPKHGYAIMGDVEAFSGVQLGPGTLYGAIARLEKQALIEPLPGDDRRRPYGLTALGQQSLEEMLGGLRRLTTEAEGRLAT